MYPKFNRLGLFFTLFALFFLQFNTFATVYTPNTEGVTTSKKVINRQLTLKEKLLQSVIKRKLETPTTTRATAKTDNTNSLAICGYIAMLLGILILLLVRSIRILSPVMGLVAIIFSSIALDQIRKKGEKGLNFAIKGLAGGVVLTVGWTLFILLVLLF